MAANNARYSSEGLTIMFEHCTDQPYYSDSGRSSPANSSSPSTPVDLFSHSPLDVAVASEDSWNLIPYDVPWGPEYYHYRAGTLPGPDGACIFLRSPTPLKNRRTQKACNKCRQRKAKCSGTRPSCTRCLARGYVCEYVEEDKPEKQHSAQSGRSYMNHREGSACSSETADASYTMSDNDSYHYIQSKMEDVEPSTPDLLYPDGDAHSYASTSPTEYDSQWDESQYTMAAPYGYEPAPETYCSPAALPEYYEQPAYPIDDRARAYPAPAPMFHAEHPGHQHQHHQHQHHPHPHPHPHGQTQPAGPSASVRAPRPVRCTGSPSFLTPEERMGAFASVAGEAQGVVPGMQPTNDMLINLAAAAEPAPQIALPQVPPMAPTQEAAVAVEYAQPQPMYYYPPAEQTMPYPYLQYQYAMPAYAPTGMQEGIAPTMLYTMPVLSAGMTA